MEETTGAPSSFAVYRPRRLRASSRDGGDGVNQPPSTLTMLLSRHTRRREFITLLGGTAATWPRAQQPDTMRRIGVLMSTAADDAEGSARIAAFLGGLGKLGWIDGHNVRIDTRWPTSTEEVRKYAAELIALAPDVILATGSPSL